VHLAITDHDEYLGSLVLCQRRGDLSGRVVVGEELTIRLDGHVFHLGISGLDASTAAATHARLQETARDGRPSIARAPIADRGIPKLSAGSRRRLFRQRHARS